MQVYNLRLDERVARKAFIQAHDLLNLRRYQVTMLPATVPHTEGRLYVERSCTDLQVARGHGSLLLRKSCMTRLGSMPVLGHVVARLVKGL